MKKLVITEEEKREILAAHTGLQVEDIVIFKEWLTPDDKYLILFDNLIDVEEKKWYGNIWENFSNMVVFIDHLYEKSNFDKVIKEHAKKVTSKLLLTESRIDLRPHLPEIQRMMIEEAWYNDWGDFKRSVKSTAKSVGKTFAKGAKAVGDWAVDTAKSTAKGIKDFGSDVYQGVKDFGGALLRGDWQEILNLIKKGMVYLARKVRQALYSTVGMIVDAILIATGIGKAAQFVVWAIVVALDIYEFTTGDFEHKDDPMWMRYLFFGIDIFAMCTTGALALPFIVVLRGMRGIKGAALAAKASKPGVFRNLLLKIKGIVGKAGTFFSKAVSKLKASWIGKKIGNWLGKMGAKLSTWIKKLKGSVDDMLGSAAKKVDDAATKIKNAKGKVTTRNVVKAGVKATIIIGGIEVAMHAALDLYNNYQLKKAEENRREYAKTLGITLEEYDKMDKEGTLDAFIAEWQGNLSKETVQELVNATEITTGGSVEADYWEDAPPVVAV